MTSRALKFSRIFSPGKNNAEKPTPAFKQLNAINQLSEAELNDLLLFCEQRTLHNLCPSLSQRKVLLLQGSSLPSFVEHKITENPASFLRYIYHNALSLAEGTNLVPTIKGNLKNIPLRNKSFDLTLIPFATMRRRNLNDFFSEFSRLTANFGQILFSVIHPALELFLYNQNPASYLKSENTLQKYFYHMRKNDLYLDNVEEAVIDTNLKPFFSNIDSAEFQNLTGIPLVLFVRATKFKKNDASIPATKFDPLPPPK